MAQIAQVSDTDTLRQARVLLTLQNATGGLSAASVAHMLRCSPYDASTALRALGAEGKVIKYYNRGTWLWKIKKS